MFYDVLWCSMMFSDVLWCSMMSFDAIWCAMMFYDTLWYSMVFNGVLWCSMMLYYVLWCSMLFYVLRAFLVSFWRSVPPEFLRSFFSQHYSQIFYIFCLWHRRLVPLLRSICLLKRCPINQIGCNPQWLWNARQHYWAGTVCRRIGPLVFSKAWVTFKNLPAQVTRFLGVGGNL